MPHVLRSENGRSRTLSSNLSATGWTRSTLLRSTLGCAVALSFLNMSGTIADPGQGGTVCGLPDGYQNACASCSTVTCGPCSAGSCPLEGDAQECAWTQIFRQNPTGQKVVTELVHCWTQYDCVAPPSNCEAIGCYPDYESPVQNSGNSTMRTRLEGPCP